ncbi:tape measure protein [Vibrio cincinnatiensis]|uniref:tape measure protein n=1 Tax=Vibrio cincinnatiensis TaxID=675 RepID=UPI001FAA0EAB|nr:tape measure protein [Vibrio cincinnatiensis]
MSGNSNDLKLTLRFNAENKEFLGQVKASSGAISDLGSKTNRTGSELSSLAKDSQNAGSGLSSLKGRIFGLVGGFSALATAINAKDRLGEYQDMRTQITALVGGQQQWIETERYLNQVAEEHNKTILDMAGNYSRLAVLQEAGLVNQVELTQLFEGMSNAQSQLGAETTQLNQAMYGLSQALASPIVRAEELNQVVEPLPGLLNKMDKAAGLQSGGFRRMLIDGKVTSEFFKTTLIKALDDYAGAAARTAENVNAQQASLARSYQQLVIAYEKPIAGAFNASVSASSSVLDAFASNAELVSDVIGVTLFAAIGRGTVAIADQTKVKLGNIAATRQGLQTTVASTQAELMAVNAEIRHLEVMQISNNQKFRAIGAEGALTAAQARRAVLTDTLTAAQARLNVVSRAGSALMATLGGPAGIAMMAAGALSYFAISAKDAQKDTKGLKDEVNALLGRMGELQAARIESAIEKQKKRITELRTEYAKVALAPSPGRSLWQSLTESNSEMRERQIKEAKETASQVTAVQLELSQAEQDLSALEQKLAQSKKQQDGSSSLGAEPPDGEEKALKSGEKMLAMLSRQVALYGQTSEVAKVRYEIEHGELKGINEELKNQLLLQAQILDSKRPQESAVTDFFAETDEMESAWLKRLAMEAAMENKAIVEQNYAYDERLSSLREMHESAVEAARGNKELLAAIEAEYRYQQEIAEADHQARLNEIEAELRKQREEANKGYWQRYLESAKANLENFDSLAKATIDSFSSGMGNAFESMMFDADNLGDAMFNLAEGMSRAMVNALGRMAAEWLAYKAVQMLVGTSTATAAATSISANAQAASLMAGINAYSSTAAMPIVGPLAAPAAMSAALAATAPVAASVSALAYGGIIGMAHDGISRVPKANEGTWLLKKDEMVMNTEQTDNFYWMLDVMRQMKTMFTVMKSGSANQADIRRAVVVNIHPPTGTQTRQESTTIADGQTQLDFYIEEAKNATLGALYQDADNGGPISTRIRAGT